MRALQLQHKGRALHKVSDLVNHFPTPAYLLKSFLDALLYMSPIALLAAGSEFYLDEGDWVRGTEIALLCFCLVWLYVLCRGRSKIVKTLL